MKKIVLSPEVSFPLSFVTNTTAVLARRGAGKSYTASVIAEQVMEAQQPVIILDPLGAFWGLRSSADGKRPGFAVIVLGGRHGDVPLEPTAGKVIAALVVEKPGCYVIDLSLFESNADQDRFAAEFLETLYRMKARHPTAQLLIVDEADSFAPQTGSTRGGMAPRLLGAMEAIVRRGRSRGLGVVLISQRSAVLNKNVLTQAENLIVMQTTGPQDIKAIEAWIEHTGDDDGQIKVLTSLHQLLVGEAWVWSPAEKMLLRTKIQKRTTFDSSATPKPGEVRIEPRERAEVDLEALGTEIKATVERAKENDPRELKARISNLQREIAGLESAARIAKQVEKVVERSIIDRESMKRVEMVNSNLIVNQNLLEKIGVSVTECLLEFQHVRRTMDALQKPAENRIVGLIEAARNASKYVERVRRQTPPRAELASTSELTGTQQKILDVIAMLGVRGIPANRDSVARWLDIHPNGGRYGSDLAALRANNVLIGFDLTSGGGGLVRPIETGLPGCKAPLDGTQRTIIDLLAANPKMRHNRDTLAASLQIHPSGGRYGSDLARLRTMGLIPERGDIYLTEAAFR